EHALGDRTGGAANSGIDWRDDVALLGRYAVASKVDECEIRSRRALLELFESLKKPVAVCVEATRRLAVAGHHLKAVLREQLRHAGGIGHRITERPQACGGRGTSQVGILPDHQRDALGSPLRSRIADKQALYQHGKDECER